MSNRSRGKQPPGMVGRDSRMNPPGGGDQAEQGVFERQGQVLIPGEDARNRPDSGLQATVASSTVQFHTSRASIAASLRQMKRGIESDLSRLAGAVAIVHQRTLATAEAKDGTLRLLQ
eukprot:CAMPEP_0180194966 /NCGR_PEP_ID=MMETSP0987-20121128/3317_1 /TAXON_ID=697907 /ORGANISM="non described non described, Strain CCMP2293" /LENGTH=117 /DNA_ID=CAMNT_0022149739 /DNA_START=69 /DNA_END=419 /DNA_ORIENTATION=-